VEREKNVENTQRYSTSLQVMDWDYARRFAFSLLRKPYFLIIIGKLARES
jgi:hypothetical protein